ncbi:hypothetical protein LX99_02450 [Mucilaginibacter oryzae]|uniref:Uncharacterized protein n=1 Tax=Mucilaginibacter oryzae TaxID=468058 RepID=A0A316HBB7_9SPHI|nr:hypothetical protein [Mucilaginibacter oryzae]PWK77573.1 hypothetical protein LX99_02450 [Mucilaginibacter oryzae]
MEPTAHWNFQTSVIDGHRYDIDGLNVWDFDWKSTGESFSANDPIYNNTIIVVVYEISSGTRSVQFGAVEVSNLIWLIYQKADNS